MTARLDSTASTAVTLALYSLIISLTESLRISDMPDITIIFQTWYEYEESKNAKSKQEMKTEDNSKRYFKGPKSKVQKTKTSKRKEENTLVWTELSQLCAVGQLQYSN